MKKKMVSLLMALFILNAIIPSQLFSYADHIKNVNTYVNKSNDLKATADKKQDMNKKQEDAKAIDSNISKPPKYVFLFIGDGMGLSHISFLKNYNKSINSSEQSSIFERFNHMGLSSTHSLDSLVTDSAAAGTAIATGKKTNNGMVSISPTGEIYKSLAQSAIERGLSVGLATTTIITDATPAVFLAHNKNRYNSTEIAAEYLNMDFKYLVGGGLDFFMPNPEKTGVVPTLAYDVENNEIKSKRNDDLNLINAFESKGYNVHLGKEGATSFKYYTPRAEDKYIGIFSNFHMPYEIDSKTLGLDAPKLSQMTKKGIELLYKDKDGFFFMVEGGRIDHASHSNDAGALIYEMAEFESAIKVGLDFYRAFPEDTLIVVTADHETGGLALGHNAQYALNLEHYRNQNLSISHFMKYPEYYNGVNKVEFLNALSEKMGLNNLNQDEAAKLEVAMNAFSTGNTFLLKNTILKIISDRAKIAWTTTAHTATYVPVFAIGQNAEKFTGVYDNVDIYNKLFSIMQLSE